MKHMNPVVHFEIPYRDGQRATKFYAEAFGWKTNSKWADYIHVTTVNVDASETEPRGAINGGLFPVNPNWPSQHPAIFISVENIHAAMKRITQAGGEILGEPMTVPEVGEYVSFLDPEGNRNSIIQLTIS